MSNSYFQIWSIVLTIISITFSLGLIFSLNQRKSNYARILRHVIMSESIYLFALLFVVIDVRLTNYYDFLCNKLFRLFMFNGLQDDYSQNCIFIRTINIATYHGLEAFSIWLNVFICLEVILILKNPIAQMKSRLNAYFIISSLTAIIIFIIDCSVTHTVLMNPDIITERTEIYASYYPK
jgi:hypothetical protein